MNNLFLVENTIRKSLNNCWTILKWQNSDERKKGKKKTGETKVLRGTKVHETKVWEMKVCLGTKVLLGTKVFLGTKVWGFL